MGFKFVLLAFNKILLNNILFTALTKMFTRLLVHWNITQIEMVQSSPYRNQLAEV